ncbi:MAG: hypothetical protein ABIH78_01310 [Candidatus Peregrinibacteria bacterium]
MNKKSCRKFGRSLFYGVSVSVIGIVVGFLLGFLISFLSGIVSVNEYEVIPRALATFLGMGAGAIIGGIYGLVLGYKE